MSGVSNLTAWIHDAQMNCRILFFSPIQMSNAISQKPARMVTTMTTFMLFRHSSAEDSLQSLQKCPGPTRVSGVPLGRVALRRANP